MPSRGNTTCVPAPTIGGCRWWSDRTSTSTRCAGSSATATRTGWSGSTKSGSETRTRKRGSRCSTSGTRPTRAGSSSTATLRGKGRTTSAAVTDYVQISNDPRLKRLGRTVHYPTANPPIADRFATANAMFATAAGVRRMFVDPACRYLIQDLEVPRVQAGHAGAGRHARRRTHLRRHELRRIQSVPHSPGHGRDRGRHHPAGVNELPVVSCQLSGRSRRVGQAVNHKNVGITTTAARPHPRS